MGIFKAQNMMLISNQLKKLKKNCREKKSMVHISNKKKLLLFALFANFKTKNGRTAQKNEKHIS